MGEKQEKEAGERLEVLWLQRANVVFVEKDEDETM